MIVQDAYTLLATLWKNVCIWEFKGGIFFTLKFMHQATNADKKVDWNPDCNMCIMDLVN
jgi:hypothetical protein